MFQDPFGNFANFPTLLQPYLSPIYTKDNNYKVLVITLILWEFCWNRFLNLFFQLMCNENRDSQSESNLL